LIYVNAALAATAFVLLTIWKFPPWIVVLITAAGGVALALLADRFGSS
jgi:chromate transporter